MNAYIFWAGQIEHKNVEPGFNTRIHPIQILKATQSYRWNGNEEEEELMENEDDKDKEDSNNWPLSWRG